MTSAHGELFDGFAEPQREFSPVVGWWWTADRVELPRLCWQLDELDEHGILNVLPINLAPAGPLYGALADDPPLFSEAWWSLWQGMCEHAQRIGTRIWFYDQIGFGGSNTQGRLVTVEPDLAGGSLERVARDAVGRCELQCPSGCTPVGACALPLDESGNVVDRPVPIDLVDDRAVWEPVTADGRYRVMLAYSRREGFDYLSPRACARLLDEVHGEFERRLGRFFGVAIVGSFQDELPDIPTWSDTFVDEFERRCGYPLAPVVAALWEDWGLESGRVRAAYQRVRAALAEDAFFRPLFAWHEERGMTVGFDQQSPSRSGEPVGTVQQYADYLGTHRWYSAPGSDHWGDAKIHSSLAHHYGRPRTWIEAFHSTGWGGTLEETFDWLMPWLLAGANLYMPHAVYYSTHGGWWEWAPPSTCWRQPYWRHYRTFADAVTRLCWLLTRGEHVCDVGVLYPTTTIQAATFLPGVHPEAGCTQQTYFDLVGHMLWFYTVPGAIAEAGHDFDVLDDDTVAAATVSDGSLQTEAESYRAVIVPACRVLEPATAATLVTFCEQGGLLVFVGKLPEHASHESGEPTVRRLRQLVDEGRAEYIADSGDVAAALDPIETDVTTEGLSLRRKVGDSNVLLVPAAPTGSAVTQPTLPWVGEVFEVGTEPRPLDEGFFADIWEQGYEFAPDRYRSATTLRINGSPGEVEQWDPATGRGRPAVLRRVDGGVDVEVRFTDGPAAILVWRDEGTDPPQDTVEPAEHWAETSLDGPWAMTVIPTIDNRYGDLAWPPSDGPLPVQAWRLRHALEGGVAGSAKNWHLPNFDDSGWADVLVGCGPWAWLLGPVDPVDAPLPLPPDHRGPLVGSGWKPVVYSLSRGIEKDPIHGHALGPKAWVPEDFWHVDDICAGQLVVLRTSLPTSAVTELTLAVGSNGLSDVWWNGKKLPTRDPGDLRLDPVMTRAGPNLLEIRVAARRDGPLRGYWALTADPASFMRPEWLAPGDGSTAGSEVRVRRSLRLTAAPTAATLQVGTRGAARLLVNGQMVGSQGTFDPYGNQTRVIPYEVADRLHQGENVVEVVLADTGTQPAMLIDGVIEDSRNGRTVLITDDSWSLTRDGVPVPVELGRHHPHDPRWPLLWARPHPLPRATWLERHADDDSGAGAGGVLDMAPDPRPGLPRPAEWFRLVVPPGAAAAHLPVEEGSTRVWLDGEELRAKGDVVSLPHPQKERRVLAVRVEPTSGHSEGALWLGPVTFEMTEGRVVSGDWANVGLSSYSGGIAYRRTLRLDSPVMAAVLDLGSVRGTAEVVVNGRTAGVRIWSPYRVDITEALVVGDNEIEVRVFNTLASYIDDVSPTRMVYPGQRVSGLCGPVRLLCRTADPDSAGASR